MGEGREPGRRGACPQHRGSCAPRRRRRRHPRAQGLWQDAFTGYLGGSRDPFLLTDPGAVADGVRASMGTLVGAPLLPAFLVTPGAAVLTGALEAGFYYTCLTLQNVPRLTAPAGGLGPAAAAGTRLPATSP